ncbi:MAG: DUF302 domain-containing protein [Albidovulum sp.]
MFRIALAAVIIAFGLGANAQGIAPRDGWVVVSTPHDFATMTERVVGAAKTATIAIVTQASASDGARSQGIEIAGNRVFGLFRNDYARRMLAASVVAGIEAPIRLYLTENSDGTTTLSYKTPTAVFAPYADEGGEALAALAGELDTVFAALVADAASR